MIDDANNDSPPSKRQKLDIMNFSNIDPSDNLSPCVSEKEMNCLLGEITTYRARLCNTEATAAQLRLMQAEIKRAVDGQEEILSMEARIEKDLITHLEERLATAQNTPQNESQVPVNGEISAMKMMIRAKIDSIFTNNTGLTTPAMSSNPEETPTSSKPQQGLEINLQQISNENIGPRTSDLQSSPPAEVNTPSQSKSVNSEKVGLEEDKTLLETRANELEKQLQSATNMILSLREDVKKKLLLEETVSTMTEKLKVVPEKRKESSSRVDDNDAREHGIYCLEQKATTFPREADDQRSNQGKQKAHQRSQRKCEEPTRITGDMNKRAVQDKSQVQDQSLDNDCKLKGTKHEVIVSDERFFSIKWAECYRKINRTKFICNKCSAVKSSRWLMEDHVWVQHYGGAFKCPRCPDYSFFARAMIGSHMKSFHSDESSSKDLAHGKPPKERGESGQRRSALKKVDIMHKNPQKVDSQIVKDVSSESRNEQKSSIHGDVKKYRFIQVDRQFFKTSWDKYMRKTSPRTYTCRQCLTVTGRIRIIQEHVWVEHLGKSFKCLRCSAPKYFVHWFANMASDKIKHSKKCPSTK